MEETTNTAGGATPSPKSGNKTIIIVVVILLILIVGGFLMRGGKAGQSLLGGNNAPTSLKALMALGVPQQCTFSVKNEGANGSNESTGTVYLSGNKMRMDTESHMNMAGKETLVTSHMISDGEYYYMWSDQDTRGMKIKMTEGMMNGAEAQNQQKPLVDPDTSMDYRCSPGLPDSSKLEAPKDITFMDMNEMMGGIWNEKPETGTTVKGGTGDMYPSGGDAAQMKAMQCSACDQAGDQKAACQKALGC
jgi:hypothetical protein